jgi:hypothetical protein
VRRGAGRSKEDQEGAKKSREVQSGAGRTEEEQGGAKRSRDAIASVESGSWEHNLGAGLGIRKGKRATWSGSIMKGMGHKEQGAGSR